MRFSPVWIMVGWLLLAGSVRGAEFQVFSRDLDPFTHTEVQVSTPFELVPARGFIPMKVTIRNNFPQERTWEVEFRSQPPYGGGGIRFVSSFQVVTPGLSETTHSFMVPLASKADRSVDGELAISVQSGRLVAQGTHRGLGNPDWRSAAFSNGLAGLNNLEELTKAIETRVSSLRSGEPVAAKFDPAALTTDWRGLTGFDAILISSKEWDALEPSVRQTVLGWARMGGSLYLFGKEPAGTTRIGMGAMVRHQWDGLKIPVEAVAGELEAQSTGGIAMIRDNYLSSPMQKVFGIKDFNPVLVFLILAAFAIVVGPINLQVWAKPGMRHRLFITTPIISLSASLILLLIILLGDGLGGSGMRVAFLLLRSQPEERQAHLVQEQIARTGVLAGRSFPASDLAWLTPVVMSQSRWTHFDNSYTIDAGLQLSDGIWGGDWFRSRSEQMHLARAVIPTRARMEVISQGGNGTPPQLFNSLGYGLAQLHYQDPSGACWRSSGPVASGQPVTLEPIQPGDYEKAWRLARAHFSQYWNDRLNGLSRDPGQFLAEVEDPSKQMLATLGSIRWRGDRLFVIGEPVGRTPAAPAP